MNVEIKRKKLKRKYKKLIQILINQMMMLLHKLKIIQKRQYYLKIIINSLIIIIKISNYFEHNNKNYRHKDKKFKIHNKNLQNIHNVFPYQEKTTFIFKTCNP